MLGCGTGIAFTITKVSGTSFFVRDEDDRAPPVRHDLCDWLPWLLERAKAGPLMVDGEPVQPPVVAPLFEGDVGCVPAGCGSPDGGAQARRVTGAVREVLRDFTLTRQPDGPEGRVVVRFTRRGWAGWYTVTIDPAWRQEPTCTCADSQRAARRHPDRFCRHVVAALLRFPEHGHQLIDALL
jgi:hypothetical protein